MYLFVVNKKSANGGGYRTWKQIETMLKHRRIPYKLIYTESPDQAQALVTEMLSLPEEWRAVAVIGGDGTIHSVLPALRGQTIPLAVIPAGSGNDTARAFHIPFKPADSLDVMLNGTARQIDLISTSGDPTVTALAIGFDAEIAHTVNNRWYKKFCNMLRIGSVAYIIGLLELLVTFKPAKVTLSIDGETKEYDDTWMTAVSNIPSYGGGMRICPQAQSNDGILDICIVHRCTRLQLFRMFPTVLSGQHVNLPFVTMLRGRTVTVQSERPFLGIGDGELVTTTPLTASVDEGALFVLCPKED
ncbi:diacylglycerol kinase family protein [Paenibacillus sediminis]|uniref:YegS/Rv2252/BmrU family lipid kinase n=1 Tax=Paenibacillus sediminis TaxID=664909 RepID=A0ABS4H7P9_9BACL|nr:diacylglycerol kinase family protein [Paenibacillus sediminis]MBP1938549.1 YegS/Rv2252/BmrU family lipid kinase [Paenibacillus sediminis]